jgi:hypothetical protein
MTFRICIRLVLTLTVCLAINNTVGAQSIIPANDAPKYVGKVVSFVEMVDTVKYDYSSKTCFIHFPNHKVRDNSPTIILILHNVYSTKRIHWLKSLQGNWINVTGRLLVGNGNYTINGGDTHTKLSKFFGMIEVPEPPPVPQPSDTAHHK